MKYKVIHSRSKERSAKYFQIYFRGTVSFGECCRTDRADYDGNSKLDTMPNRNRLYEEESWHSRGL